MNVFAEQTCHETCKPNCPLATVRGLVYFEPDFFFIRASRFLVQEASMDPKFGERPNLASAGERTRLPVFPKRCRREYNPRINRRQEFMVNPYDTPKQVGPEGRGRISLRLTLLAVSMRWCRNSGRAQGLEWSV
jgi:hypothetical protein